MFRDKYKDKKHITPEETASFYPLTQAIIEIATQILEGVKEMYDGAEDFVVKSSEAIAKGREIDAKLAKLRAMNAEKITKQIVAKHAPN